MGPVERHATRAGAVVTCLAVVWAPCSVSTVVFSSDAVQPRYVGGGERELLQASRGLPVTR